MTTPTVTSSTDSQMHNNIIAAGSRDRPPMLATGRYPQWRSWFLRYIDTRLNGEALRKCILSGPYKPTTILVQALAATDDSPAIPEHTTLKKCGKLSKGYNKPEWSRFVTIVKQQHKLDEVLYHKLFDILKQYQKEVNELRAERLAKNANPLALVATAQANQDPYYQTSKSHKSYAPSSKPSIPTRSYTTTRYKGKEIAKLITPPFETAFEKDSDPEQAQRDKDMNKNVDTTPRQKNDNQSGMFGNQRTVNVAGARENLGSLKAERVKDFAYHKEKMLLYKQAEQDVPLQAEQYDWLADTDEEIDEQELKAHYSYMAKIQEVPTADSGTDSEPLEQVQHDTGYNVFANDLQHSEQSESISNNCLVETDDSNVILDSPDTCEDDIQNDQNDVESDDERVALANLKLNVDENKKIQKQLKKANTTLAQELKECKTIFAEISKTLGESISVQDSCLVALLNKQTEFKKYKAFNDRTIDYEKLKRKLNETLGQLALKDIEIKEDLKAQLQDKNIAISDLKKLIEKGKGKSVETKFDKPSFVRQPNVQRIPKTISFRPQHRSNQLKDKVMPNNSQVKLKKTQVEVHSRIPSVSNKMKSVTACKDILNSITLNANAVCATCNKCLVDSNHFACVTKMLNDVNARTKEPNFAPILGYGDLVQGNITINRVYYVEGFNHNLFSFGQFCDADLEVAFRKSTCFVRDLQGNDLLTSNRGSDLYTISFQESTSSTPLCLMAKASPTQAWLWHRRLSHLNFDYINLLLKKDVVIGVPKFKCVKDQLCSFCELSKAKRSSFKSKAVPSSKGRLNLLHMDLCGPMRVASINRKKYVLVIVDDCSKYTWTLFLCSKDETPEVLKEFLAMIQRNLQAPVITVQTDKGTEFLNKTLNAFFKEEGIEHQNSTARTPEQNGVVERQNCTMVEAARTMLSALKLPLFFCAEAIATACYTQNRSIIILTHDKTVYHIINDKKPSIKHLYIFSCICYITRDGENLDKIKEKGDLCILVGYSKQSKGYHVYNKRTRLIVESIHSRFDEIKEVSETFVANDTSGLVPIRKKALDYDNSDPVPKLQNVSSLADAHVPLQQELDLLFGPLYDEFFNASFNPQDKQPITNIQPTSAPSTPTYVHAEENDDDQAEEYHLPDDEFTNPFYAPT
nr:retrovirus-related Pol polyprotein from transposon TNT 1-94 [Tanacetum cinerariifolium]